MSFAVDKWPLVQHLSPGFSVSLGGICKSPRKSLSGAKNRSKTLRAAAGPFSSPLQVVPLAAGGRSMKAAFGTAKRPQSPQHNRQNTGTASLPSQVAAPHGLARGAWGSGCSSNVLLIHSGSSRAPRFVGISHFSLAESSAWLAGNPVPSTRAWPGANR